jgi:hypothetical protein
MALGLGLGLEYRLLLGHLLLRQRLGVRMMKNWSLRLELTCVVRCQISARVVMVVVVRSLSQMCNPILG